MNSATNTIPNGAPAPSSWGGQIIQWSMWIALLVLCGGVVELGRMVATLRPYEAGSALGYNLGLAGGLGMLSLLIYTFRKRMKTMDRMGGMQSWFRYHMIVGVAAPVLVLFHSTFRIGSMNGAAALYSMLVVAISGVVGRFIYRHIHQGLYGKLLTLTEAEQNLKGSVDTVRKELAQYPDVARQLEEFRQDAFAQIGSRLHRLWRFMTLRLRGRAMAILVRNQIKRTLYAAIARKEIPRRQAEIGYLIAKEEILTYVDSVCKASQLKSWERLFALWHLAHIPFIYLLIFSGIVHVIAVHIY